MTRFRYATEERRELIPVSHESWLSRVLGNDGEPERPKITVKREDQLDAALVGEHSSKVIHERYLVVVVAVELVACVRERSGIRPYHVEAPRGEDVPECPRGGRVVDPYTATAS